MTVVIIGIGNTDRGDDGAGVAVTAILRRRALPVPVAIVDSDGDPARLLDAWEGADAAILVDTVHSHTAPAGHVHHLTSGWIAGGPATTHGLGPGDAIALGAALGRLPDAVEIYAIEGDRFDLGAPMSPAVAAAVQRVAGEIAAVVEGETCA